MKFLTLPFSILCMVFSLSVSAQKQVNQVQPMIMVVPFAKEGENVRQVLEDDVTRRVALTKVKEAFDNRGFSTVDFLGKLKASEVDRAFGGDAQTDVKKAIIEASGADIYVDVEVAQLPRGKYGNSVRLILTAYDAFTGVSLSNKTGSSPQMDTEDFGRLVENALKAKEKDTSPTMLEDFLNVMQTKFTDIVENGRTVKVQFVLSQDAAIDFDTEFGPDALPLSAVLETWMEENAYKNYFTSPKPTATTVLFDEVRIPLRDETGKNYTSSKFALQIMQFCNKLTATDSPTTRLRVRRDLRGSGTILITVQ